MIVDGGWGPVRALRLAGFAVAVTVLSLGAHLAGGGGAPSAAHLAVTASVAGMTGLALTRRRRGFVEILVVLTVSQVGVHLLLVPAAAGHEHPMHPVGTAMLLGHAAAVLLSAGLLARGERGLQALVPLLRAALAGLRSVLVVAAPAVPMDGRPRRTGGSPPLFAPRLAPMASGLVRRGPPALQE